MATPVEMPKPGNTVDECLLAKWIKAKGDSVSAGDVIAEIETDKATFEVSAPASGTLLATFFSEGALVPVFTNICVIGAPGEDPAPFSPAPASHSPVAAPPPAGGRQLATDSPPAPAASTGIAQPAADSTPSPRARRFAREHGVDLAGLRGSGPGGRILEQDVRDALYSSPRLSPLARRRAAEGFEIPESGAGINGMILAADLTQPAAPLTGIREKIARRMRDALASTAQYTLTSSADATAMLAFRRTVDANVNELVLFCTVKALLRMPHLNAELKDGKLYQHSRIHLGFACDTERGLMVPVIRDAHAMSLAGLAAAVRSLAARAVKGSISPDDLAGATFTVSNLGSLGIESFTPILNAPQVAILGVNNIQLRPVRRNGAIEFVDHIGFSLTCDHQIIDGAPGARFLGVLGDCIRNIETLAAQATPPAQ